MILQEPPGFLRFSLNTAAQSKRSCLKIVSSFTPKRLRAMPVVNVQIFPVP